MSELLNLHPENLSHANWQQPGEASLPVLSVRQIRLLEEAAFGQTDSFLLMQAAGIRSAQRIADQVAHSGTASRSCLVLAGPGNNGGDGCIVAGELRRRGLQVKLLQVTEGRQGSKDRMQAVLWALAQGVQPVEFQLGVDLPEISPGTVVIDALLGIACDRAPTGLIEKLIQHVNSEVSKTHRNVSGQAARVFSLDCPSGLNCDTGTAPGAAIRADTTFTYLACKQGLLTGQGKSLSGGVHVEDLNCGGLLQQMLQQPEFRLHAKARGEAEQLLRLPQRGHEHHKGSFGSLAVVGGQQGMTGACLLSARTALQLGCGRVALSLLSEADMHLPDVQRQGQAPLLDLVFPEIMNKPLELNVEFADTAVVGPGLGQSDEALQWLFALLGHGKGLDMVWDADALNLLAANPDLRECLQGYRKRHPEKALILTPHPLEAARLLQTTTDQVQDRRLEQAREISERFDCTVVLKGAGTLVCNTTEAEINLTGGPALGTAGSGDVLAGAMGALLGQGLSGLDAAAFAVYLHGLAVEPTGMSDRLHISHASEIAQRMKYCLNSLLDQGTCRNH